MSSSTTLPSPGIDANRRDFLFVATGSVAAVGAGFAVWPLIDNMNPSADVRALSAVEVDLASIAVGQRVSVKWRGQPVFISRRTQQEIEAAKKGDTEDLPDPQTDAERVQRAEWLVVVGICTHLGCVPLGQRVGAARGDWAGWYCPCHGSYYDTSGRIRRGPAPKNLVVPDYGWIDETKIRIS